MTDAKTIVLHVMDQFRGVEANYKSTTDENEKGPMAGQRHAFMYILKEFGDEAAPEEMKEFKQEYPQYF